MTDPAKFKILFILKALLLFWLTSSAQPQQDSLKKVKIAAIPVVNYDPSFGFTLGGLGQLFYNVTQEDTISPSSSTGLFGMYTTNKTYFAAVFQRLYLKEDTWRIMAAAGLGSINFQYWQELPLIGGTFIGFNTEATFAMIRIERRVYQQLYAGINSVLSNTATTFDVPDFFPDSLKYDKRHMNNLGFLLNYDRRDHQVNPFSGFNLELRTGFYREWMNNSNDFNKLELVYNHYYMIKSERNIIATRVKAAIAAGDVPFQGQNVVGQDDIRGYSSGKYRDNQVYAMQAEYRWRFYRKFGMVGFLGFATAVENLGEIPKNELLPGAGVGFRYLMIPRERINVGFDVAVGKDDWGIYFRIGESFGR